MLAGWANCGKYSPELGRCHQGLQGKFSEQIESVARMTPG
jgi:hypothetical protein